MIDPDRRTVTLSDGAVIIPTPKVFALCEYLAANPGHVKTRIQIMDAIGSEYITSDRSVDSLVKLARRAGVRNIVTHHGVGYSWNPKKRAPHRLGRLPWWRRLLLWVKSIPGLN